ncbi:hypothetical protein ACFL4T_10515 [candidate division KSB1 bacterium]
MRKIFCINVIILLFLVLSCGGYYTYEMFKSEGEYQLVKHEALKNPAWTETSKISEPGHEVVVVELECEIQGAESGEISINNVVVKQALIKQFSTIEKINKAVLDLGTNYEPQFLRSYEKTELPEKVAGRLDKIASIFRVYYFKKVKQN